MPRQACVHLDEFYKLMETDVADVDPNCTLKSLTKRTNAELALKRNSADAVSALLGSSRQKNLYGHAYAQLQTLLQGTSWNKDSACASSRLPRCAAVATGTTVRGRRTASCSPYQCLPVWLALPVHRRRADARGS